MKLLENSLGRLVPDEINGKTGIPFRGVGHYRPEGRIAGRPVRSCADFPSDGNKVVPGLREALELCGLRDRMTVSTHHHFRDGDKVANLIFQQAADMGLKDLVWFPSASFPCHAPLIEHLKNGVIHHIEGSMNGPLGDYCTAGHMKGLGVLRSHGGRYQAVQDGEVHIDIAVIAAPTADAFRVPRPADCWVLRWQIPSMRTRLSLSRITWLNFPVSPGRFRGTWSMRWLFLIKSENRQKSFPVRHK